MPRERVRFFIRDGVRYYALTGDRVRGEFNEDKFIQVAEGDGERRRQEFIERRKAAARNAAAVGAARRAGLPDPAPIPAGRARVRPDAPGVMMGPDAPVLDAPPAPRARRARRPGVRARAEARYNEVKGQYAAWGFPNDGPADINTSRMIGHLERHRPDMYAELNALRGRLGSHYYKYDPKSHAIVLFNHRQVYLATYALPQELRNARSATARLPTFRRREAGHIQGDVPLDYGYYAK